MGEIDKEEEKLDSINKGTDKTKTAISKMMTNVGMIIIAFSVFFLFCLTIGIMRDGFQIELVVFLAVSILALLIGILLKKEFGKNLPEMTEAEKKRLHYEMLHKAGKRLAGSCIFLSVLVFAAYWFLEPLGGLNYGYVEPTAGKKLIAGLGFASPFLVGAMIGLIMSSIAKRHLKQNKLFSEAKIESMEEVGDVKETEPETKKDLPPMLNADPDAAEAPVGAVEHKIITDNNSEKL